jgi:hypothetical protein
MAELQSSDGRIHERKKNEMCNKKKDYSMLLRGRLVYRGQEQCQQVLKNGKQCSHMSKFSVGTSVFCNGHSKDNINRLTLPKDRRGQEKRELAAHHQTQAAKKRARVNKEGSVVLCKKTDKLLPEHLLVLPFRTKLLGHLCESLCPKKMGPVRHGEYMVPAANTLHAYTIFSSVSHSDQTCECGRDWKHNAPKPDHQSERVKAFRAPKPSTKKLGTYAEFNGRHYDAVEARWFFCHWYERLASFNAEFLNLKRMLANGMLLQIVTSRVPTKSVYEHYIDKRVRIDQGFVLYCMLIGERPWNVYRERHLSVYE